MPGLFAWLETELKDLVDGTALPEVGRNEYGRCDKGLARMLLAKLYLNAEVYTAKPSGPNARQSARI